jgi:cytochrome P450
MNQVSASSPSGAVGALPRPTEPGLLTSFRFGRDMLGAPITYFSRYGDTLAVRFLGVPYVVTRDPAWIADVLVKHHGSFVKDSVTRGLGALLGRGLLVSDGDPWRTRRKAMQPHFQPAELDGLFPVFAEEAARETATWRSGQVLDLHSAMTRIAMSTALRALFGAAPGRFDAFERSMQHAMEYFAGVAGTLTPMPQWIPTTTNLRFRRARRDLRAAVGALIRGAQKNGAPGTPLENLLTLRLTDEALEDEAITLLLAGHETSSLTLTYTCALLAHHAEAQAAVAAELAQTGSPASMRDVQQASALRGALTESLRLYPASWSVGREVSAPVEVQGQSLVPGTQIFIHQWAAHRHPRWFPEPLAFRPSRWTDAFAASLPRCLYAPFGAGPRVCIGQHFALAEVMVVLGTILSQFHLAPVSAFPPPLQASITTRPLGPVTVRVEARR